MYANSRTELASETDSLPGSDPAEYLLAIAKKEVEWIKQFGRPLECDFPHNTVSPGINSHEEYLVLLQKCQTLARYLLPRSRDDSLNRPTIRHPGKLSLPFPVMDDSPADSPEKT
jgi:cysteinyl-tRNA synthetase